jgi:Tfp pilus assembly protein PilO
MARSREIIQKLDWAKLSVRERVLAAVTLGAVLFGAYFLLILPAKSRILKLDTQASLLSGEIGQAQVMNAQRRAQVQELDQARRDREVADEISFKAPDILPGGNELSSFLEELTRLARLRQVDFVSIRPQSVEDRETYTQMNLNIDVKARFRQFGEYLLMLEDLPRAIIVEEVRVETTPETSPFIIGHLNAVTFMVKE